MNVLITGARAPIAADIARALALAGHRVWAADSLRWPLAGASPFVQATLRLPAPRNDFRGFVAMLRHACTQLSLDAIIPTSEDVFWLAAAAPELPSSVHVRTSPLSVLAPLHDKIRFACLATELGYGAPEAHAILRPADFAQLSDPAAFVLKPTYSRFASRTLIAPTACQLAQLQPSPEQPWLAQSLVRGREYCLYNVAVAGRLALHVAYEPTLRFGPGAGIYFSPIVDERLRAFSEKFITATQFDGQISFDVIDTASGLVALECNPRGTSGAHLAAQAPTAFAAALLAETPPTLNPPFLLTEPRVLLLPLLLSQPQILLRHHGRQLLRAARDANSAAGLSIFAQARAFAELAWIATRSRLSFAAASTADFEWNGEPIHV